MTAYLKKSQRAFFKVGTRQAKRGKIMIILFAPHGTNIVMESISQIFTERSWNKESGGMGSFYRSRHELIFTFKNGKTEHINNFELGQHGRYQTNVWEYAGISSVQGRKENNDSLYGLENVKDTTNEHYTLVRCYEEEL